MELLQEIRDSDIFPGAEDLNSSNFKERNAARAIIINDMGQIALLYVGLHNYHKLPGGGVEEGEDMRQALRRESLEEIGCDIEITDEVGEIIEYKSQQEKKQTSHCYIGNQAGELQNPAFTDKELSDGCEAIWVDTIEDAITLIKSDTPADYVGHFIQRRDTKFLEAAQQLINNQPTP